MNNLISVSIIIPCFERTEELERLLISLKKLDFTELWEVIVIDDGSRNHKDIKEIVDRLSKDIAFCSLIRLDNNIGTSKAKNIGVKKSKGEFVWFLDSDTEVSNPNLLTNLIQSIRQDKSLGGVGGEIIKIKEKKYIIKYQYFPNWIFLVKHIPTDKPFETRPRFIATNNLLVSKKDFLSINGFLPYLSLNEDVDFCLRLARLNKSFLIKNNTCIIHHHSTSGRQGGDFWFFNKTWNYISTMHFTRIKILFFHFPYRLLFLPLLDIIFTPIILLFQITNPRMRSSNLLEKKSEGSAKGFFILISCSFIAMILAWLKGWGLIIKSLSNKKEDIVKNIT